jgi:hypothetical protein
LAYSYRVVIDSGRRAVYCKGDEMAFDQQSLVPKRLDCL